MINYKNLILLILVTLYLSGCGNSAYREREYASEAQAQINIIYNVCKDFVNSGGTGELPTSLEEMEELNTFRLEEATKLKWEFEIALV